MRAGAGAGSWGGVDCWVFNRRWKTNMDPRFPSGYDPASSSAYPDPDDPASSVPSGQGTGQSGYSRQFQQVSHAQYGGEGQLDGLPQRPYPAQLPSYQTPGYEYDQSSMGYAPSADPYASGGSAAAYLAAGPSMRRVPLPGAEHAGPAPVAFSGGQVMTSSSWGGSVSSGGSGVMRTAPGHASAVRGAPYPAQASASKRNSQLATDGDGNPIPKKRGDGFLTVGGQRNSQLATDGDGNPILNKRGDGFLTVGGLRQQQARKNKKQRDAAPPSGGSGST
jgi:hypothetical protein